MRFAPPTREELTAYIAEKGYKVDADRWLAYYESNGWKVGRNPMKDWKAAVRTWASNGFDSKTTSKPATKAVTAQQYEQREYSKEYYAAEDKKRMQDLLERYGYLETEVQE